MHWFFEFIVAGIVMLLLDGLWLGVVANKFYRSVLGDSLRKKPSLAPAVAFYVLYLVGITVFVTQPASTVSWAIWHGALFGLCAYGTYDLTNASTLKVWATKLTLVDMAWGAVITAAAAGIAQAVAK